MNNMVKLLLGLFIFVSSTYSEEYYSALREYLQKDEIEWKKILTGINRLWYYAESCTLSDKFLNISHNNKTSILDVLDTNCKLIRIKNPYEYEFNTGITVHSDQGKVKVSKVYYGSPAWFAGLLPEDEMLTIDNCSTNDLGVDSCVELLSGYTSKNVNLKVQRNNEVLNINIVTQRVDKTTDKIDLFGNICYVKISEFTQGLADELYKRLKNFRSKYLIIDLRYNEGGILTEIVNTASIFLPFKSKVLVLDYNKCNGDTTIEAKSKKRLRNFKNIYCIIDSTTTFGAEAFAAALSDNQRAVLIGTPTKGNFLVSSFININDSLMLKISHAEMIRINQTKISKGIAPQVMCSTNVNYYFSKEDNLFNTLDKCIIIAINMINRGKMPPPEKTKNANKND